jgi:hypothetical protein
MRAGRADCIFSASSALSVVVRSLADCPGTKMVNQWRKPEVQQVVKRSLNSPLPRGRPGVGGELSASVHGEDASLMMSNPCGIRRRRSRRLGSGGWVRHAGGRRSNVALVCNAFGVGRFATGRIPGYAGANPGLRNAIPSGLVMAIGGPAGSAEPGGRNKIRRNSTTPNRLLLRRP